MSLGIGDPNGYHLNLSFYLNGGGTVREDVSSPGKIIRLLKTSSSKQDFDIFRDIMSQKELDDKKYYLWDYTCIGYTKEKFDYIKNKYNLKEVSDFKQRVLINKNRDYWISYPSTSISY